MCGLYPAAVLLRVLWGYSRDGQREGRGRGMVTDLISGGTDFGKIMACIAAGGRDHLLNSRVHFHTKYESTRVNGRGG